MLTLRARIENKGPEKPALMKHLRMNQDNISALPDEVLHLILSLLPPREVVRTSLLSKRWQKLWVSLPYIHFEYDDSAFTPESFRSFGDNFLHYHDKSIILEFLLSWNHARYNSVIDASYINSWTAIDASYINSWISAAVSGGVHKLQLIFTRRTRNLMSLPSCLFTCNSLVTLELNLGRRRFLVPEFFCLPNLKSINLSYATAAKNFCQQLLKSPNLEKLALLHFEFDRKSPSCIQAIEGIFTRLKEAAIHFSSTALACKNKEILFSISGDGFSKFMRKLSNVEFLTLGLSCVKILRLERKLSSYHLPLFCNLNRLKVYLTREVGDVEVMAGLLCCSPILQSLHIAFRYTYMPWRACEQLPSLIVPSSLEWIKMDKFDGKTYQYELLKQFLGNTQGLKKIIVAVKPTMSSEFREKLFGLRRPSTNYELVIK